MKKRFMFFFVLLLLVPLVLGAIIISNKPIDPEDANLHYITGNALYNIDEYTEAIKHFKQAVNINPDFEEAHNNLAYLYYIIRQVNTREWQSSWSN